MGKKIIGCITKADLITVDGQEIVGDNKSPRGAPKNSGKPKVAQLHATARYIR